MIVLFPEPLGPTTATLVPATTEKLRSLNTILEREGYAKPTPENSIFPTTFGNTIPSFDTSEDLQSPSIILMIFAAAALPLAMEARLGAA